MIKRSKIILPYILSFLLGVFAFFVYNHLIKTLPIFPVQVRENSFEYHYINPLLECDTSNGISNELNPFKTKVQDEIDRLAESKQIAFASVYFRDMDNGPFFDINGDESFMPASLLKVPLMIAYYKKSESDPSTLDKKITYTKVLDTDTQYFKSPGIVIGNTYTVEQLIEKMIINSDNNAYDLLLANIDSSSLEDVFQSLDVQLPTYQIVLTVKQYATFFRILFNASYLNDSDSEHALKILNNISFNDGLQAGVPSNIKIADKYGEKWSDVPTDDKQLHDCGIVYYPNHPYLLCVMTRGTDFNQLASAIADISKTVYNEVDYQIKN